MDQLLESFHSDHDDNLLDIELRILPYWLVVSPSSNFYTLFTMLFHKCWEENVAVKNCTSHFYMFVPTKANAKLANVSMGHAQGIRVISCSFTNFPIIYPVELVYYFPGHPSSIISLDALKYFVGFQKVASELIEHCDFLTLEVVLGDHPTRLKTI